MNEIAERNMQQNFYITTGWRYAERAGGLYRSGDHLAKIQVRPLEEAMDAHLSERGHTQGKVVLRI